MTTSTLLRQITLATFALTACTRICSAASPADLSVPSVPAAQPSLKLDIKLDMIAGLPVVDDVYLNGQGPYRFLLDTGSQTNQVDASLAKKLGIAVTRQVEQATPTGFTKVSAGTVHTVALGAASVAATVDQDFIFLPGDGLHQLDPTIRGILGQQFLSHFNYTLDFKHHRLTFGDDTATGEAVKFRKVYGCMAVTTDLGELLLDSGTQKLFLFAATNPASASNSNVTTANGRAAVSSKRAPSLSVAGKKYYPEEMLVREVAEAPTVGLLPATLFHAIHVSNTEGTIILNPGE